MQFDVDAMRCDGCANGVANAIRPIGPEARIDMGLALRRDAVASASDKGAIAAGLKLEGYLVRGSASSGPSAP
jgi:copper chaperone CopZ